MRYRVYWAAMALSLALSAVCSPAKAGASDATSHSAMFVVLTDDSMSIREDERRFYWNYLEKRVLPLVGPGDTFVMGEIGANASTSFREQIHVQLPEAIYQSARVMSLAYFEEQADESEVRCIGEFERAETELENEVARKAKTELEQAPTADHTCLVDTINDVADTFGDYSGSRKLLLIFSDGVEDCGNISFDRSIAVQQTLRRLESERRIPDLSGVRVLFMRRSDRPVPHVLAQTRFWREFFRMAKAQSIQIDPQGEFNFGLGPVATVQQRCAGGEGGE